ncbi:hypothetical protein V6N13_040020 [Hibiscus sabdariffa]
MNLDKVGGCYSGIINSRYSVKLLNCFGVSQAPIVPTNSLMAPGGNVHQPSPVLVPLEVVSHFVSHLLHAQLQKWSKEPSWQPTMGFHHLRVHGIVWSSSLLGSWYQHSSHGHFGYSK